MTGKTVAESLHKVSITERAYYNWEKEYGALDKTQARKLKELQKENQKQKKKLAADISLDKTILPGWVYLLNGEHW